jgi:16S rRNA C967 or C1407 C5-methylase (RsmB/RsmF family)
MSKVKRTNSKQDNLTAIIWKSFDSFYQAQWGVENWSSLKQALLLPKRHVARINDFLESDEKDAFDEQINDFDIVPIGVDLAENEGRLKSQSEVFAVDVDENAFAKSPPAAIGGLRPYYVMDLASIFPALALNVQPGDRVLDMCAAPGGKTLILAEGIKHSGFLVANEISSQRRARLKQVIEDFVPTEVRQRVTLSGYDGTKWPEQKMYDAILLDAPCSGERHLIANPKEFKTWTQKRSKTIAQRQAQLLHAAAIALKTGGRLVYSTCSISHLENDDIVQKVIEKHKHVTLEVIKFKEDACSVGSPTSLGGWQILPDQDANWGPIYFCMLQRVD